MAFDITDAKARMQGAQDALQRELGSIRTGRANPRILDRIEVEYYGAMTPLNQVASISVPEARILLITPFDKSVLDEIIRAINMSDLGLNPASDGNIVRLAIPQMTEEGRKELAKQVKAEAGFSPRSDMLIARIISSSTDLSNGVINKIRASGTEIDAT